MKPLHGFVLASILGLAAPLPGADEPLVAGQNDVPVPKRTKMVSPQYPPEAQARGLRGIVILEVVIDTQGKVSSVQVIRSVPPFDEPATAAVRQWEYEVTKVQGKPVSVKFTVPILFAMKLPEIAERQEGIPELRAGAVPPMPADQRERGQAAAEVTLDADGAVEELRIVEGSPALAESLTRALRTWRFASDNSEATVSFRVGATFIPPEKGGGPRVEFRLDQLRRSESQVRSAAAAPEPPPSAAPSKPEGAPAAAPPTTAPTNPPPPAIPTPAAPTTAAPTPATPPATPAAPAGGATAAGNLPAAPPSTPTAAPDSPPPPSAPRPTAPAPATEVLTAPPPPEVAENGLSAVPNVTLSPGVPDLTRGRKPVTPPFARMSQTTGTVEVAFSVDAAGITSIKGSSGPDVLKPAAEQAVGSWSFRRTRADRIFLVAEFKYAMDNATAAVRPDSR